jgi:hypothetical protein
LAVAVGEMRPPEVIYELVAKLRKPGALTTAEYELVKQHAALGAEMAGEALDDHKHPGSRSITSASTAPAIRTRYRAIKSPTALACSH